MVQSQMSQNTSDRPLTTGQKITIVLDEITVTLNSVYNLQRKLPEGQTLGGIFVEPVTVAKLPPLGWKVHIYRSIDGKDPEWVPYAFARDFETGHIRYVMGSLNLEETRNHEPKKTLDVLYFLRDTLRSVLPKISR